MAVERMFFGTKSDGRKRRKRHAELSSWHGLFFRGPRNFAAVAQSQPKQPYTTGCCAWEFGYKRIQEDTTAVVGN